jgi:heterodisulfide reductase subunit A
MSQIKAQGSVMVIGGGIAGIQAALSLSAAGYGVYLVERSAQLGGMIPSLHRIYPLCACCKLDPRVAACGQDPNIKVMLNSHVADITGEKGNFKATVQTDGAAESVTIGAVVLAAGIETFEPTKFDTYAYGRLPNVVTSVEFEALQKPLGAEQGVLKRPSDGKTPAKVAWLQCVGSREINQCDAPYCSSVCCMHALKEAVNTKELKEDIETSIFFMDMRTHGKGFEDYLNTAVGRGVRLVRSRVHTIEPMADNDDLVIGYADEAGEMHSEVYDMVVLSVGLRPSAEAVGLARKIGLEIKPDSYLRTEPFQPVATNLPGIYVCGGVSGPHDIGQAIEQAAASVAEIASFLQPKAFSAPRTYPKPTSVEQDEPRVLVAYQICSGMDPAIGKNLADYAVKIPGVVEVFKTGTDIATEVAGKLADLKANRVVFASCTPIIHKNVLEEALKRAGLNPYLYETVDLRALDPQTSLDQLKDRIRMGVARATFISPPSISEIPVVKSALVVGGGVSGMESALAIAKSGYSVTLVEKQNELGGHGRHVRSTWQGDDAQAYLAKLMGSIKEEKLIKVMTGATVKENKGVAGSFLTTVVQNGTQVEIAHGVTILASGGQVLKPAEYLYGKHKKVFNWQDLSQAMIANPAAFESANAAVFIQCVGSREPQMPHCSNLCCTFAVRTAVDLKTKNPDMDIYILYREMRTFGEREELYSEARKKGIIFIRYELDNKPSVEALDGQDRLKVTVFDHVLRRPVILHADFVSLQSAIVGAENPQLADIFKISLDSNGFFAPSAQKMKPLDATSEGIYLAGLAQYPKDTGQSIAQAKGAAARALEILSRDYVQVGGMVAEVRPEKCAVCCTCVRTCPFHVPFIDPQRGAAYINPGLCQGCGMCVAECPAKAIVMAGCSDQMLTRAPSILLGRQS